MSPTLAAFATPMPERSLPLATGESDLSKPGSPPCSGISVEDTYLLTTRCPVFRRRNSHLGFRTELETLVGHAKGKVHWRLGMTGGLPNGSPVRRESHAGFCERLAVQLRRPTHQRVCVVQTRRQEIPKDGGKVRVLSIPAIRDRVAQGALKLILEPVFEADFQPGEVARGEVDGGPDRRSREGSRFGAGCSCGSRSSARRRCGAVSDARQVLKDREAALQRAEQKIATLEAGVKEQKRATIGELALFEEKIARLTEQLEAKSAARLFAEGALQTAREERGVRRGHRCISERSALREGRGIRPE